MKGRKMYIGLGILLISQSFGLCETAYFGWNLFPGSLLQGLCDTISIIGTIYGSSMTIKNYVAIQVNEMFDSIIELFRKH